MLIQWFSMTGRVPNAVSCAIFSGSALLLVQRAYPPYKGYWTLPGGRMEAGENPESAVRREVREELGLTLGTVVPIMLSQGGEDFVLQVFAARIAAGVPTPSDEIADWCWAETDDLGRFRLTPGFSEIIRTAAEAIKAL